MGYSFGLLPGHHDPTTQRYPIKQLPPAANSHSAKPSVQLRRRERSGVGWLIKPHQADEETRNYPIPPHAFQSRTDVVRSRSVTLATRAMLPTAALVQHAQRDLD